MTVQIRFIKVDGIYRYCCGRVRNVTFWERIGCAHDTPRSSIAHSNELEARDARWTESELRLMDGNR